MKALDVIFSAAVLRSVGIFSKITAEVISGMAAPLVLVSRATQPSYDFIETLVFLIHPFRPANSLCRTALNRLRSDICIMVYVARMRHDA